MLQQLITRGLANATVMSGIQPTGSIHFGNYLGAIQNWVNLQNSVTGGKLFFCIVDQHALTVHRPDLHLGNKAFETAAILLACGIDPLKSRLFVQSTVLFHTNLAWILFCLSPVGQLSRMTQWKSKSSHENQKLGLLAYPILQAADILLYKYFFI